MTNKKELKSNANYFLKNDAMRYIGIGLMILSGVLFYFGFGWISYILMCLGLPVGFLLFLLSTFGRSSESDIDEYIKRHTENVGVNLEEDKAFNKRLSKRLAPEIAEGYEFTDGVMLKKGKNGTVRSSLYTKAIIYPFEDAMLISYKTLSLISDEETKGSEEISYAEVISLRFEEEHKQLSFRKSLFRTRVDTLIIECASGKTIRLPMQSSVKTDTFVERINEIISDSKK